MGCVCKIQGERENSQIFNTFLFNLFLGQKWLTLLTDIVISHEGENKQPVFEQKCKTNNVQQY